jgi:hypothetical protein
MANAKISALPAVTTPASTDEFAVNQGGTTKKETRAQIHTLESGEFLQGTTGAGVLDLRGDSGASTGMRIKDNGAVLIGATVAATTNPQLDVVGSTAALCLANSATDATTKLGEVTVRHRTIAEESMLLVMGQTATSFNKLFFGGGSSRYNTATEHAFYTAADTTTTTGTVAADIKGVGTASILRTYGDIRIDKDLNHDGDKAGFFTTAPVSKPTGVAISSGGIHAALVTLGLIAGP